MEEVKRMRSTALTEEDEGGNEGGEEREKGEGKGIAPGFGCCSSCSVGSAGLPSAVSRKAMK